MKRAASLADAKTARDVSIECMALLDRTIFQAKKTCPEEFFLRYRQACGFLMGEFAFLIMRVREDFPELDPSDEDWHRVASERVGASKLETGPTTGTVDVRAVLGHVRGRLSELRNVAPRLLDEPATDAALKKAMKTADDWPAVTPNGT